MVSRIKKKRLPREIDWDCLVGPRDSSKLGITLQVVAALDKIIVHVGLGFWCKTNEISQVREVDLSALIYCHKQFPEHLATNQRVICSLRAGWENQLQNLRIMTGDW